MVEIIYRRCGKCGRDLMDGDGHLCVRCMAAAGGAVTADMPKTDGDKDKKKPKQTES